MKMAIMLLSEQYLYYYSKHWNYELSETSYQPLHLVHITSNDPHISFRQIHSYPHTKKKIFFFGAGLPHGLATTSLISEDSY